MSAQWHDTATARQPASKHRRWAALLCWYPCKCSTPFSAAFLECRLALNKCLMGLTMSWDSLMSCTSQETAATPVCHESFNQRTFTTHPNEARTARPTATTAMRHPSSNRTSHGGDAQEHPPNHDGLSDQSWHIKSPKRISIPTHELLRTSKVPRAPRGCGNKCKVHWAQPLTGSNYQRCVSQGNPDLN
jgi:hypothetical protein